MKKLSLILMFLVSAMVCGAQDFQSGDLLYEIISDNPPEVSLFGHVDGQDAQGELNIPATVQFEGVDYTVAELSWYAFNECHGLTGTLVIPNTVRVIGEYAFYECDGLSGPLVFPESVIEVKVGAFCHCTGFTGTLTFPDSMTKVGDGRFNYNLADGGAFQGCLGFNRLELPASLQFIGVETFADCANLTGQLILPEGVTTIECNAFENCTGFTGTLVIPESVETVEGEVFNGCTGIENLVLPNHFIFFYYTAGNNMTSSYDNFSGCDGLTHVEIPEGWERTGFNVFTNCANLTSVHLPESLSIIDNSCFYNCTSLTEINFPEGLVRIGTDAFHGCTSLSGVSLPNSLIELCIGAFNGCTGLTGDLVIPDLVEDVMLRTFENCTGLNRVILGASVKLVYESAFNDTQLESLFFKATTPPQLERFNYPTNQVWDFPADLPIIVPCGTLEAYQNAEGWNEFTNITEDCGDGFFIQPDSEWYYEILNDDGSITYQHLEYVADTTVSHKDVKIIIRNNTLYDKTRKNVITKEYLYEENNKLYWWNSSLQNFTLLYDFNAEPGDEWTIHVGTESLTVHVDAVGQYYYDGRLHKMLRMSDPGNLFSGEIVYGIGHLTSFFPERLMTRGKDYRVEGIRCFWQEGELVFQNGEKDCDEVYEQYHSGLEETSSDGFRIYPNPTNGLLVVETFPETSPTELGQHEYRVTNLIGQTLLTGLLTAENHQINVSSLPDGLYFITIGNVSTKLIIRH